MINKHLQIRLADEYVVTPEFIPGIKVINQIRVP
jgi:hypothetical protein